jgi:hypothetical protein
MNPFKKQSNNLEEEPGNIALNGRNKVVKKKEMNTIENKFFVITGNEI